ncbi:MAG: DUF5034 domain-containing protein [Lentimicrobium sp.]|jgi:hypothetical protein|nr:DUF5034 domain-containing protein [Lentimicrobium sp.]
MRIFKKTIFILLIANVLRIIPGCCECDDTAIAFDFNTTDIRNLDNSGEWVQSTFSDTMLPGAVAFEVNLYDSMGYYGSYAAASFVKNIGFTTSQAFSCDCSMPFMARQFLEAISITTLFPLSESIPAGTNVSGLFVGQSRGNSASSSSVYNELSYIIRQTENKTYYDGGIESFGIYLKPEVKNTLAQFEIQFTFSDGLQMTDTTNLIHILH